LGFWYVIVVKLLFHLRNAIIINHQFAHEGTKSVLNVNPSDELIDLAFDFTL